jgi:hypothetical protein
MKSGARNLSADRPSSLQRMVLKDSVTCRLMLVYRF